MEPDRRLRQTASNERELRLQVSADMNLNWNAISAIGEIVGAAGVIVSLVYLAIQIRAQNRESKASSIHEITDAHRAVMSQLQNRDIADIWDEATRDFENLNRSKQVRFVSVAMNIYKVTEEAFYQSRSGRLDAYIWEGIVAQIKEFHSWPGARCVWSFRKRDFSEVFVQFIDGLSIEKEPANRAGTGKGIEPQ